MNRREFNTYLAHAVISASTCSLCSTAHAWPNASQPSENQDERRPPSTSGEWPNSNGHRPPQPKANLHRGCSISGAQADSLISNIRILQKTGWDFIDQAFALETRVLSDVTQYSPGFAFFDDSAGPNAFASPEAFLGSAHGSVVFGINLLRQEQSEQNSLWDAAAVFIMAHEWTHIVEFNQGVQGPTPQMELLADFVAGWYLGWKLALGSRFDPSGAARSVFSKGDYAFNSPSHHGTPRQRLAAATQGSNMAMRGVLNFPQLFSLGRRQFNL